MQGAELQASQRIGRGQRKVQAAISESDMLTTQSGRTVSEDEAGPLQDEADMEEEVVGEQSFYARYWADCADRSRPFSLLDQPFLIHSSQSPFNIA